MDRDSENYFARTEDNEELVATPVGSDFLDSLVHHASAASTIWTFRSEWSSNYTASNLPGPSRNLENRYSLAGKSLEHRLGRLAYNTGEGNHAMAEKTLRSIEFREFISLREKEREDICKTLVDYARMEDPNIQALAFRAILRSAARYPDILQPEENLSKSLYSPGKIRRRI